MSIPTPEHLMSKYGPANNDHAGMLRVPILHKDVMALEGRSSSLACRVLVNIRKNTGKQVASFLDYFDHRNIAFEGQNGMTAEEALERRCKMLYAIGWDWYNGDELDRNCPMKRLVITAKDMQRFAGYQRIFNDVNYRLYNEYKAQKGVSGRQSMLTIFDLLDCIGIFEGDVAMQGLFLRHIKW